MLPTKPRFDLGAPGTGKTRTLAALLAELLHQDQRILVTSTTNAAVDQALEQLAKHPGGRPFLRQHKVIRMGQNAASHPEMTLLQVAHARDQDRRARLEAIGDRLSDLHETIHKAQEALDQLEKTLAESQLNLFSDPAPVPHILPILRSIFSGRRGPLLAQLPPDRIVYNHRNAIAPLATASRLIPFTGQSTIYSTATKGTTGLH